MVTHSNRRTLDGLLISGPDARIIMGADEAALIRLWREKRGEVAEPDDSRDRIAQLNAATRELSRSCYERRTGRRVIPLRRPAKHSAIPWMVASFDGVIDPSGAVFRSAFVSPALSCEQSILSQFQPELQHTMWVTHRRSAVLSVIIGDGRWLEMTVPVDPLYLTMLVAAEKKFWRCVQSGEPPRLLALPLDAPRPSALRVCDMSASDLWAESARIARTTHAAHLAHESARHQLQAMLESNADVAIGHGVRVTRGSVKVLAVPSAAAPSEARPVLARENGPSSVRAAQSARKAPQLLEGCDCRYVGRSPRRDAPTDITLNSAAAHSMNSGLLVPGTIDKSMLALPAPRRYRAPEHLRFVAQQPCLLCGRKPSDAHHLRFAQPRALGRKASDEFVVPLCRIHHRSVHSVGDERGWWANAGIDPLPVAREFWTATVAGDDRTAHDCASDHEQPQRAAPDHKSQADAKRVPDHSRAVHHEEQGQASLSAAHCDPTSKESRQ